MTARTKRAAALVMALLTVGLTGSAGQPGKSAEKPRAVAALGEIAATGTDIAAETEIAAETGGVSAQESAAGWAPVPEAQATDVAETTDAASARAANLAVQELSLKAITLPDIPADASAPAQVKSLPDSGMVCLTFDDGYSKASIETILDCLKEYDVHCTFFIIGSCLKLYPELWRRAVAEGHEIAYHTMSHRPLTRRTNAQIVADINEWNKTAAGILGPRYQIPKIARAPGGTTDTRVRRLFAALGYTLIYWSSDTFTGVYRRSHTNAGARVASYILRRTTVGSISLQHFNACDAASVSRYIGELNVRFRLGTVSEALAAAERHAQKEALVEALKLRRARPYLCDVC